MDIVENTPGEGREIHHETLHAIEGMRIGRVWVPIDSELWGRTGLAPAWAGLSSARMPVEFGDGLGTYPTGLNVGGPGLFDPIPGSARTLELATVLPAGRIFGATVYGETGDHMWLPRSPRPDHELVLAFAGVAVLPCPPDLDDEPAVVLGPGGSAWLTLLPLEVLPGQPAAAWTLQTFGASRVPPVLLHRLWVTGEVHEPLRNTSRRSAAAKAQSEVATA